MALVASVYTTVVIAFERYVALQNPFTMRTGSEDNFVEKWLQVIKWVGPAIIFSIVFNIPMFFEHCFLEADGNYLYRMGQVVVSLTKLFFSSNTRNFLSKSLRVGFMLMCPTESMCERVIQFKKCPACWLGYPESRDASLK